MVKVDGPFRLVTPGTAPQNHPMTEVSDIGGYHAHVYFDAQSLPQARALCEAARDRFSLQMGRVHERTVGPHPMWSCQLLFPAEKFAAVVPWLHVHRNGLIVFVHTLTGDDLWDHTHGAMWLGESVALKLDMFELEDAD